MKLRVNGQEHEISARGTERLLDILRDHLGLTGTKDGCTDGSCGACAVLLDGRVHNSCLVAIAQVRDRPVRTVEGLSDTPELARLQKALATAGVTACGFCLPGMLAVAAEGVVRGEPADGVALKQRLAGVACRCTGYRRLLQVLDSSG